MAPALSVIVWEKSVVTWATPGAIGAMSVSLERQAERPERRRLAEHRVGEFARAAEFHGAVFHPAKPRVVRVESRSLGKVLGVECLAPSAKHRLHTVDDRRTVGGGERWLARRCAGGKGDESGGSDEATHGRMIAHKSAERPGCR